MKTAWQSLSDFPPNCHKSLTDFFLHSFFFWLRLIKWSSCLFFPLPPEAENAHFGETTAHLLLSLYFMPVWMDSHWEGCPSPGTLVPAGLFPCSSQHSSRVPAPGQPSPAWTHVLGHGHCKWIWYLLIDSFPPVWSHAVSSPCFHWKFRGDFSMGWWHRNSLCASVHWPDEPRETPWQTWWTLRKLPKRELVADLELLTWCKPWATQWLLLFSWLPWIAAWRRECSISGFCF